MVSLSEGRGGHSHSFRDIGSAPETPGSHISSISTEQLLQQQPTHAKVFRNASFGTTVATKTAAIIQAFVFVAFEVVIFILSDVLKTQILGGVDPPFALLTCVHVGVWLIVVVIDRYLHYHHRILRTCGYLAFYTATKNIRRFPLWVMSIGNAALLVTVSILGPRSSAKHLVPLFKVIVSSELFFALLATIVYIVKISRFNKEKKLPDAFQQKVVAGFVEEMYVSPEIGFRNHDNLDEVLEKQTEMIRYLQQHNAVLGKKIVEISQHINRLQESK